MIAQAKSIAHGISAIRYMAGETGKHDYWDVENIYNQNIARDLDARGLYALMGGISKKDRREIKNNIIRIELSPTREHSKGFTNEDWKNLWNDFIIEFSSLTIYDKKGNKVADPINATECLGTVWLHTDTDEPHLHAALSRCDRFGHIINDSFIGLRAQKAAANIAIRRGWQTAPERSIEIKDEVAEVCLEILKAMPKWDWNRYINALNKKGWKVKEQRDKQGKLHGYSICIDKYKKYKSSELGTGRALTVGNIEKTWSRLHSRANSVETHTAPTPKPQIVHPIVADSGGPVENGIHDWARGAVQHLKEQPGWHPYSFIREGNKKGTMWISPGAHDTLEFYKEDMVEKDFSSYIELDMKKFESDAVSMFVGLLVPDIGEALGGGGSDDDSWWKRQDGEDDQSWMYRCCQAAEANQNKIHKTKYNRPKYKR